MPMLQVLELEDYFFNLAYLFNDTYLGRWSMENNPVSTAHRLLGLSIPPYPNLDRTCSYSSNLPLFHSAFRPLLLSTHCPQSLAL